MRSVLFALPLLISMCCFHAGPAVAGVLGLLVPAYFYPGTGGPGGVGDGWSSLSSASASVPLIAIFNPNSGPAPGPPDPNYVQAMTQVEKAGGQIVAYAYTGGGTVPLSEVEQELSTYVVQYGSLIQGFFFDVMTLSTATVGYYDQLETYARGLCPSCLVMGNPGQPSLGDLSPAQYLSVADTFNIFEGPDSGPGGFSSYPGTSTWFLGYTSDRFSNIIYSAPVSSLVADLTKAVQFNAGDVYVTDDSGANPFGYLPSYWDQEVAAVSQINALPEPSSIAILPLGALILFCRVLRRDVITRCSSVGFGRNIRKSRQRG